MSKLQKSELESKNERFDIVSESKQNVEELNNSNDFNLDVNIIISIFQEKLNSLMTELVIKEATIKQQANIIKKLKGE